MTLIRNDTQAEVENIPAGDIDIQRITAWINNTKYVFYNVYWPNHSFAKLPFDETTYKRTILAGDFNAHIPMLGYKEYNHRGREVEDLLNSTNLILDKDMNSTPTLLHRRHLTTSRPDLIVVSADLYEQITVRVGEDIDSDHSPVLIKINKLVKPETKRRPFWSFKRADWDSFACITDTEMGKLDLDALSVDQASSEICSIILKAAKKTVPQGHRKKYKPYWNAELQQAVKARRKAKKKATKSPTPENKTEFNKHTAKVRLLTRQGKRGKWIKTCEDLDLNKEGKKAWKLLQNL